MNRYQKLFNQLKKNKSGAFVPFITLGDPNPIICMRIIDTLIYSGCDALELGFPFSDPLSDGPSIQKSMKRAFSSGINFKKCFNIIDNIRQKYPDFPIGILIYSNIIFKNNIEKFYIHCATLNIDSILIPDVPIEESLPFYKSAKKNKIAQIFICPPNATIELIKKIVNYSDGYIYLSSRAGVTGKNKIKKNNKILESLIKNIRNTTQNLPILQGFGIYRPKQAKKSLLLGTSGVIVGSAISDIIEKNNSDINNLLKNLNKLASSIKKHMIL